MTTVKRILLWIAFLSCAVVYTQAQQASETKAPTTLQIDFPRKRFNLAASFTNQVYNDKAYVEAFCTSGEVDEFRDKDCDVVLINFDNNSVTRNKTCQTGFHAERGVLKSLFVHQERNDTVVLPYLHVLDQDEVYFKFRMIRMSTCEFYEVILPVDSLILREPTTLPQILMYDDGSFDLFVPNNNSCTGARCKLTYDSRGNKIAGPVGYLSPDMEDRAVFFVHGPTSKSYYAFVGVPIPIKSNASDENLSRLFYVNETKYINLLEFDFNYRQFIDDSHGHFGFCFSSSNDTKVFFISCTQYEKDKQIINVSFELGNSIPIATYNVPGGGILLVSSKCSKLYCENLVFQQITLDGRVQLRHTDEFEYLKPSLTDVSDGDGNQLCLTLYSSLSTLHLYKKCYPKNSILLPA